MDIASIRPIKKQLIIDAVAACGIDVGAWSFKRDGITPVKTPQSNGGFCYEWSFRGVGNTILVLCVWYEELVIVDGVVKFFGNLKKFSDDLIRELEKQRRNQKRTVTDPRINRADHFTQTVRLAYDNETSVRVVIVRGPVRVIEDENKDNDRAIARQLDSEAWNVEFFNADSGEFVLVRSRKPGAGYKDGIREAGAETRFVAGLVVDANWDERNDVVDQFVAEPRDEFYVLNGEKRRRDPNVRRQVLARSKGLCELTGVPGFETENGGTYLETHHIVPLCEGGPDTMENMIALSAEAHRMAHYGRNRDELRSDFIRIIQSILK
ncbi:HNH endonuclease [Pseudomonas caspiana]|uniref:HNH nuclease domain-containing protein n=1 Tax=Pseudomonas caspiana TaxID=1451454 RepID=A0A1Y3PCF1_9PSED|nr:HNH endonuclease [Pseudomonas caspiana]OUM74474.1 hypothetical protein AUC60_06915 [Pseudomonas caspiana]